MTDKYPSWFLKWSRGEPYITSICDWTRADLIGKAERETGWTWGEIYRRGGRAVQVRMSEIEKRGRKAKQ